MRHFSIRPASFNGLISLANRIQKSRDIHFECKTEFFRPFCVAFLDQYLLSLNRPIRIYSTYMALNQYLWQVKFPFVLPSAKKAKSFPLKNMILLKRFTDGGGNLNDEVPEWLENDVFSKGFAPNFSIELKRRIVKNLWEIIFNAIQHSQSKYGISCCGQFYPVMGYFEIAFYDNGVGIPFNVRAFLKPKIYMTDHNCIVWALEEGNTTKPGLETGGAGLFYLREFLKLNGGCLQIVSRNGMYQSDSDYIHPAEHIENSFKGTLFNLRIIYDDHKYKLKGED